MKTVAVIAKWCGHLWIALFAVILALSIIGTFLSEPSFATGWRKFTERFSPYNLANLLVTMVLLMPAFALYQFSEHLESKTEKLNGDRAR
jgi:hypothetical protein